MLFVSLTWFNFQKCSILHKKQTFTKFISSKFHPKESKFSCSVPTAHQHLLRGTSRGSPYKLTPARLPLQPPLARPAAPSTQTSKSTRFARPRARTAGPAQRATAAAEAAATTRQLSARCQSLSPTWCQPSQTTAAAATDSQTTASAFSIRTRG